MKIQTLIGNLLKLFSSDLISYGYKLPLKPFVAAFVTLNTKLSICMYVCSAAVTSVEENFVFTSPCFLDLCTVLLRINAGGVHLILDIFFWRGRLFKGGIYTREALITKYRKSYNSIYQRQ